MWMVIACTRAHLLTRDPGFLKAAKTNFDLCYERVIERVKGTPVFMLGHSMGGLIALLW